MGNRILIGNRSTGGYGLYVSKTGDNVLDTSNALAFDPRSGSGWTVQSYGQNTLTAGATRSHTHSLGYNPLFAVRWSTAGDITSSLATKVYTPRYAHVTDYDQEIPGEPEFTFTKNGLTTGVSTSNISVLNNGSATIYYGFIIFNEPDFTGGLGL
jgi:hypothetical protein